jgi:hypothetical protein
MLRSCLTRPHLLAFAAGIGAIAAPPALAQSAACLEVKTFMTERQTLIQQLNKSAGKDRKLDPRSACGAFGKLLANGETGVKWIEANKDLKQEHEKVKELRGQACQAAAKMLQMEKARQSHQGNPFGGGLTGEYKIPQGAL